jgi:glutamate-5-semialdehyde dehydrogenase
MSESINTKMKTAIDAKSASVQFAKCSEQNRNDAICEIGVQLSNRSNEILAANKIDIEKAKNENLSSALLDRLLLDKERLAGIISSVAAIAKQSQVVGEITESNTRGDGLIIEKQRIPLGVVGMIFESRPNVVIDCSCLAIKSGNCIVLKGGSEAKESNRVLADIVQDAIQQFIPKDVVQLIDSRAAVAQLLNQVGLIDVIIPRGGEKLIKYVYENSKVPVIAHFKGLCHIFIDESADLESALAIILNAKAQRPGVCNAMETLILHSDLPQAFITKVIDELIANKIEVRADVGIEYAKEPLKTATIQDWETEYLDRILSIKLVNGIDEAINHIHEFGSHHSEAIISSNQKNIDIFKTQVDASSIMINASTRFNDGGEYGLGAELGISTTKLHAYGPMGAREMTTTRYLVTGKGHVRS